MHRLTRERLESICDTLSGYKDNGKATHTPSYADIRSAHQEDGGGTCSNETIAKYLPGWERKRGLTHGRNPDLPEPSDAAELLLTGIREKLEVEYAAREEEIKEEAARLVAAAEESAQNEIEQAQVEVSEAKAQTNEVSLALSRETDRTKSLDALLQQAHKELAGGRQELGISIGKAQELERQLNNQATKLSEVQADHQLCQAELANSKEQLAAAEVSMTTALGKIEELQASNSKLLKLLDAKEKDTRQSIENLSEFMGRIIDSAKVSIQEDLTTRLSLNREKIETNLSCAIRDLLFSAGKEHLQNTQEIMNRLDIMAEQNNEPTLNEISAGLEALKKQLQNDTSSKNAQ